MSLIDAACAAASTLHDRQIRRDSSVAPTPRRFLLEGLGLDRRAEPVAYFEYEELYGLLKIARTALEKASGLGLEQITLRPGTWFEELELLFRSLPDSQVPRLVTLRPGCEPKVRPGTCRFPTVGVVAVAHFALICHPGAPLARSLRELKIVRDTTSYGILKAVDPSIRTAAIPDGLGALRDKLVPVIPKEGDDGRMSTARLLHRFAERYHDIAASDVVVA